MNIEKQYVGLLEHSRESNDLVKECLKTALIQLTHDRSYKDVSISELCRRAGVSRMAFYRNYSVINDLFHELAVDLNRMVIDTAGSPFRKNTSEDWYIRAFRLISDKKEALSVMFSEYFQAEWMRTVNEIAVHDENFPLDKKYQRLMWCGGFENAVACWLSRDMKESPEEMAAYCMRYLPHISESDRD